MCSVFPANKSIARLHQQGAALILALVVFGIVALLAVSLSADFLVAIRRVENQLHGQQANAYLRGAEGLARNALQLDLTAGKDKDHISEGWLDNPQEFPLEGGLISGVICDLQGKFNLNNLSRVSSSAGSDNVDKEIFIRMLQTLALENPLDQAQAEDIANAVIDWIDADDIVSGTGGAEEGYYSDLDVPHHAGNRLLHSVSELRWVKGISDELYRALEPAVTVLPTPTAINVNTAGVAVLQSLNELHNLSPISIADAERIIADRDGDIASDNPEDIKDGFSSVTEFITVQPLATSLQGVLAVTSDYFLLDTTALFLERQYRQYSVIHRDASGNIKTLARAQSGLGSCRKQAI